MIFSMPKDEEDIDMEEPLGINFGKIFKITHYNNQLLY